MSAALRHARLHESSYQCNSILKFSSKAAAFHTHVEISPFCMPLHMQAWQVQQFSILFGYLGCLVRKFCMKMYMRLTPPGPLVFLHCSYNLLTILGAEERTPTL